MACHIGLLLWKNFILFRRKWLSTIFLIILPPVFMLLSVAIRGFIPRKTVNASVYESFTAPNISNDTLGAYQLCYTPKTAANEIIVTGLVAKIPYVNTSIGFEDENAMVSYLTNVSSGLPPKALAGIVFPKDFLSSGALTYELRFPHKKLDSSGAEENPWFTDSMFPKVQIGNGPRNSNITTGGSPFYWKEGFLELQSTIDMLLIDVIVKNGTSKGYKVIPAVDMKYRRTPFPSYFDDSFYSIALGFIPTMLVFGYLLFSLMVTRYIIHEKESKIKEFMKMVGVSAVQQWFAWFISFGILCLFSTALLVFMFKVKIGDAPILPLADWSLILLLILFYTFALTCFCFAVSVFFQSAAGGTIAMALVFIGTCLHLMLTNQLPTMAFGLKWLICIFPNTAFGLGLRYLLLFEQYSVGMTWKRITSGPTVDDKFCFIIPLLMLLVDCLFYSFIAWYWDSVFPGEYGVPKPWYFPFQCCCKGNKLRAEDITTSASGSGDKTKYFQQPPVNIPSGISVKQLSKAFGTRRNAHVVVKDMNLEMYKGEIFVLLGHNGAGKTTTMSMLSGFIPPTSGTAIINGFDICTELDSVHKNLGLCPQYDILFDRMTVEEHLRFFSKLRGMSGSKSKEEINLMLQRVNLTDKRKERVTSLSGGMKRRLSLAIALIGETQVVILDEPTSGLDPNSRRQIWSLLQAEKGNRTMLLTTHFMDEAELLGDRVAIMHSGQVKCCGSPLFLKNCYGANYHVTFVKTESCNSGTVLNVIKKHVPKCVLERDITDELCVLLPAASLESFEPLFADLETQKDKLGIRSYGVSIITLEEVFLKVSDHDPSEENPDDPVAPNIVNQPKDKKGKSTPSKPANREQISAEVAVVENKSSILLPLQRLRGLLTKRFICFLRGIALAVAQILIPIIFFIIAMLSLRKSVVALKTSQPLTLNFDKFEDVRIPYCTASNWKSGKAEYQELAKGFVSHAKSRSKNHLEEVDLSSTNCQDYLIAKGEKDKHVYNQEYIAASDFSGTNSSFEWTAYFNDEAYHSLVITQNLVSNGMLQYATNGKMGPLVTVNKPLPPTKLDELEKESENTASLMSMSILIILGMGFLAASPIVWVIKERISRAKHLQCLTGVGPGLYWLSHFLWDFLVFFVTSLLILIIVAAFQEPAFVQGNRLGVIFLLLLLFAFAVIPETYVFSHLYSFPSSGLTWMTFYHIASGLFCIVVVNILSLVIKNSIRMTILNTVCLILSPTFCLGKGFYQIAMNYNYLKVCDNDMLISACKTGNLNPCCPEMCSVGICFEHNKNYLGWNENGIGKVLFFLFIHFVVNALILFIIETILFQTFKQKCVECCKSLVAKFLPLDKNTLPEDDDVTAEKQAVNATPLQQLKDNNCVVMKELTKTYGRFLAVDHVSCRIPPGECFGLLGVNGAGKTTIFKMLTADLLVSSGEIYINGFDVIKDTRQAHSSMGYCPQFDALIEEMTGRELLTFFCRLRGISEQQLKEKVEELLERFDLKKYTDVRCGRYSGGNKRKLSTAIALTANPKLILLDEPTTGMDPGARRHLWNTLTEYRNQGNTIVLTSHSMEECEALCSILTVMVNGRFCCFGTSQHLKAKYAQGYTVLIQIAYPNETDGEANVQKLFNFLKESPDQCELKDQHQGHLHLFFRKTPQLTWARVFGLMKACKQKVNIIHYSVTQTSLEQVFLGFARQQRENPTA